MFNWVVKVVPQPAEAPGNAQPAKPATADLQKTKQVKIAEQKPTEEASEESQGQNGVIGWLSNGFSSALPQPPGTPRLARSNSDARSAEDGERSGVIGWVTQNLTKVLPQPDDKYKEAEENNEEHTEVYEVATMPDYDPLPHIPVVEMVSEEEDSEAEPSSSKFTPHVVNWIKQIIPQPMMLPPGVVPVDQPANVSRSSLDKILSPPPESLSGISLDADSKASGVVNWFVSGLGLKMPQLVIQPRDESEGAHEVLQKASSKLKPDMILEDVESDNECQKCEGPPKTAAPSPKTTAPPPSPTPPAAQQDGTSPTEGPGRTAMLVEDAETQTGRWTPFIESIKREAEDVALATMEERLLQERMEMARLAEEVARQTAEMAVRQLASEGTSIKLSLDSQEVLEEPEVELPQEEEAELTEAPEKEATLPEEEEEEEEEEQNVKAEEPPSKHPETPSPAAPEPEPENQDTQPVTQQNQDTQPVTQQPQTAGQAEEAGEQEEEAAGDCGAPVSCDAFKSCLMRFPPTSECFGNINAFFKENGISPPKIPPLPTQLSDVTKYLPSLPPELHQEFSQIRLTQVPRNIARSLSQLLPKGSEGVGVLSGLSQSVSSIPEKLSRFPSQTQEYFQNVKNRLNSLMPQDA